LPGATTGSAAISISSPNGSPGFTGIAENGNRRDIRFTDAGVSLLTSATASTPANDNGLIIDESGNVGIGTPSALSQLAVYEDGDSATQTVFTQDIASAGVNIVTDYVNGNYTPGLFWSTADNNASMPKAGIYLQETSLGSKMLFGTSANYATGITNDALTINPSGNLGVGRVSTANALEVEGNASKTASGSWLANSDCRIKTNVRTIKNALETIDRLRPVAFRYTDEYKAKHPSVKDQDYYNYIAQEFQEVFPDSVQSSGEDGILQMDSHPAGVYAIAAIQELHQIVQEKDHKIDGLREQNEALEARLAQLEAIIHLSLTEGENP
jgi:hypothetical protein